MLIASIKSNKYPGLNNLNDVPVIGGAIIAMGSMLPMFLFHEIIQEIFGRHEMFDLSVTFFLNNLFFHSFLLIVLDIRIRLFFIPTTLFCLGCFVYNFYREYDLIVSLINT